MNEPQGILTEVPKYHIDVFWSDEDDCWIANIPDLTYCSASGDSPSEAIQEIGIALELWVESLLDDGLPLPPALYRPFPSRRDV